MGRTDLVKYASDDLDEDALLALAIEENQAQANAKAHYSSKYRMGRISMPNYEKLKAEERIQTRLKDAADQRTPQAVKNAREKKKEEESSNGRPPPGTYNGPMAANKVKAAAVVERAPLAAAARKAEKVEKAEEAKEKG